MNPKTIKPTHHTKGFTLVELMIVIAMIAVLVTVTIFGTRSFMDKAKENRAVNTLRQIAIANTQYSVENNGDINVAHLAGSSNVERRAGTYGGVAMAQGESTVADSFWGRMTPFLYPNINIGGSPQSNVAAEIRRYLSSLLGTENPDTMSKTFQQTTAIYQDGSDLPVPFAFNEYLAPTTHYVKTSAVANPAQTAYITYGWFRFNENDFSNYTPMPANSGSAANRSSNRVDYFPSKKAAVLFLDGHIEVLSPPLPRRRIEIQ